MSKGKITLQVGVKAFLENDEGKYLLLQRSGKIYPESAGKWDIVGGRIDAGSTLLENLKREIKEETQLDLVNEPKLLAAQDILKIKTRHVVRLTYVVKLTGTPVLDHEHTDHGWFSVKGMLDHKELDHYVRELLEGGIL